MNKFEKLAKIEIAYQLIAQVHSDLCIEETRDSNRGIIDASLELTSSILMFKSKVSKEIPDDTEIRAARDTAYQLGEDIRNVLYDLADSQNGALSFSDVESIICTEVEKIWEY